MKHLIAISGIALALTTTLSSTFAQSVPPERPALTPQQSEDLQARMDAYRRETDGRVARGEITADEAARLLSWREWQIARQIASAPARAYNDDAVPPDYYEPRPRGHVVDPAPAYGPYYYRYPAPYYWGPPPYAYWGPSLCAGGFGRHFAGRICF